MDTVGSYHLIKGIRKGVKDLWMGNRKSRGESLEEENTELLEPRETGNQDCLMAECKPVSVASLMFSFKRVTSPPHKTWMSGLFI